MEQEKDNYEKKHFRFVLNILLIIISAFVHAYAIEVFFIIPSKSITAGFTGLSILINMIMAKFGVEIKVGYLLVMLNLPVAIFIVQKKLVKGSCSYLCYIYL